jgi:hypothetical protein
MHKRMRVFTAISMNQDCRRQAVRPGTGRRHAPIVEAWCHEKRGLKCPSQELGGNGMIPGADFLGACCKGNPV